MKNFRLVNFLVLLAIVGLLLGGTWMGSHKYNISASNSQILPKEILNNFPLRDLNGKSYYLVQFRDRTIILHVWASWCVPCREEFPALIKAVKDREDVMLIAFSVDSSEKAMRKFLGPLADGAQNMLMVWDKDGTISAQRLGIISYPESYVLLPGFKQVAYFRGGVNDWASALEELGSKPGNH